MYTVSNPRYFISFVSTVFSLLNLGFCTTTVGEVELTSSNINPITTPIADSYPTPTYDISITTTPSISTPTSEILTSSSPSSTSTISTSLISNPIPINTTPSLMINPIIPAAKNLTTEENNSLDFDLNPFTVKEEGCPIVIERNNLNLTRLEGDWKLPYASLNWLADMSIALLNGPVKKSEMLSHCPTISAKSFVSSSPVNTTSNVTFSTTWKCPRTKHEFKIECWPQNKKSVSKFICWNSKKMRLMFLMLVATDHKSWFVLVRCSPSEGVGKRTEGMSWAILSKTTKLSSEVANVILSLLEGYGFDIETFKSVLTYDAC